MSRNSSRNNKNLNYLHLKKLQLLPLLSHRRRRRRCRRRLRTLHRRRVLESSFAHLTCHRRLFLFVHICVLVVYMLQWPD